MIEIQANLLSEIFIKKIGIKILSKIEQFIRLLIHQLSMLGITP